MTIKILSLLILIISLTNTGNCEESKVYPIYIKNPNVIQCEEKTTVFLAGGCLIPWREEFKKLLNGLPIVLLDPIGNETGRPYWEHSNIDKADILLIWFPHIGDCRGSLVELGRFLEMKNKPLFVGIDPQSPLYKEVIIQLKVRPEVKIATSIEELSTQLCHYIRSQ